MSVSPSSSPAPSSIPEIRIPDDSVIINFTSVDPTCVLDNPIHSVHGSSLDDCEMNSIVAHQLQRLLESYRDLALINMNISIDNINHQLQNGDIRNSKMYDLLDKFFIDVPDIVGLKASWLSASTIQSLVKKEETHQNIKCYLDELNCAMRIETPSLNQECSTDVCQHECTAEVVTEPEVSIVENSNQSEEETSKVQAQTQKKKKAKKNKNANK
jgi:hypothetical protein